MGEDRDIPGTGGLVQSVRRANRGRDRGGAEDEGARGNAEVLDHVGRTGDEAAAGREALGEGAHPQVDPVLGPERLRTQGYFEPAAVTPLWHVKESRAKAFVDFQNDVTTKDIALAHREIYALYEIAQAMGTSLGVPDTMALISAKLTSVRGSRCCPPSTCRSCVRCGARRSAIRSCAS